MSKFTISICPVCGSSNFKSFLTCKDHYVSGEFFDIRECQGCGLKITNNIESEENADRYYESDDYISHSNTSKGFINNIYHLVRRYMLRNKRQLIEKMSRKKSGSLLDIGTGTGFFLNEMANHGWKVTGTEKNKNARNFAKNKFNININTPSDIKNFSEKQFDVITLWHVLEHIYNLNDYMEHLFRLMKDDGLLIIAVPNSNSYDARYYKNFWAAYDVPRHIWHFNTNQMKLLGEKHNLQLKGIKNMPFDTFYISILSEKYKKTKMPLIKGVITGKISWFLSLFDHKKCSSLIFIFKKAQPANATLFD